MENLQEWNKALAAALAEVARLRTFEAAADKRISHLRAVIGAAYAAKSWEGCRNLLEPEAKE